MRLCVSVFDYKLMQKVETKIFYVSPDVDLDAVNKFVETLSRVQSDTLFNVLTFNQTNPTKKLKYTFDIDETVSDSQSPVKEAFVSNIGNGSGDAEEYLSRPIDGWAALTAWVEEDKIDGWETAGNRLCADVHFDDSTKSTAMIIERTNAYAVLFPRATEACQFTGNDRVIEIPHFGMFKELFINPNLLVAQY